MGKMDQFKRYFTGSADVNQIRKMDAAERQKEMDMQQQEIKEQLNALAGKLGLSQDKY